MKVILKQNVKKLGKKGEIKEVPDGHARNFLIPQKKALFASEKNIKEAMKRKLSLFRILLLVRFSY